MSITTNFQLIILPSAECSERHKPLVEPQREKEQSKHEEEVENMKISCDNSFESQFFSSFLLPHEKPPHAQSAAIDVNAMMNCAAILWKCNKNHENRLFDRIQCTLDDCSRHQSGTKIDMHEPCRLEIKKFSIFHIGDQ